MKYLTFWGWLLALLSIATIAIAIVPGCAGAGKPMSEAEAIAWTAANTLLTTDAANGQVLTKAIIAQALKATHNDGDASVVLAAATLGEKVIQAQTQAKASGASPTGMQAVTTAILSDPGVIQAAATAITPQGPAVNYHLSPNRDLRNVEGDKAYASIYDLRK